MRIKFLSFIASFFMVSLVITSCLDDDNNIEYSPDATIHAFAIDTIGYGINYKFTIDQQNGLIYNADSLPVRADTIIDKILIKTLTTTSSIVTILDKEDKDSIYLNTSDSVDLRNPLKIKVWSTEAIGGLSNQTKTYTIDVRVHKHDPDSMRWSYVDKIDDQISGEQKSIVYGEDVFTYAVVNSQLKVYKNNFTNFTNNWATSDVAGLPEGKVPTSIITFQFNEARTQLYATSNGDGKVYESTDGVTWKESTMFGEGVELLLATITIDNISRISYIKKIEDNEKSGLYFYYQTSDNPQEILNDEEQGGKVPDEFPIKNISFTIHTSRTNINEVFLVGDPKTPTMLDDNKTKTTIIWGYQGPRWTKASANTLIAHCPEVVQPTIINYNGLIYVFGQGFNSIYVSESGFAWKKANTKFAFPNRVWTNENMTQKPNPQVDPEFRGKTNYSMVLDTENQYWWIIFSKGTASFEEVVETEDTSRATSTVTRTYNYDSEVWRGRLNQLWFDLDPEHAGQ